MAHDCTCVAISVTALNLIMPTVDTLFRMIYTLYLPFVEGRKLSEDDGVVFLSNGNEEDVVIDLVTAERSENICHYLLRNVADFNM